MPIPPPLDRQRLVLASALYAAAIASAGLGALHAAGSGAVVFMCGTGAEAHCWACYAAPMLAATGLAVLLAPRPRAARARR